MPRSHSKTSLPRIAILALLLASCSASKSRQFAQDQLQLQVDKVMSMGVDLIEIYPRAFDMECIATENVVYAHFNANHQLINDPARKLESLLKSAEPPISDIYVLSHGWNFTREESLTIYEQYRQVAATSAGLFSLASQKAQFNPAFVFISWASVSRPIGAASASILPFEVDRNLSFATSILDAPFHMASAWNESGNAFHTAVGYQDKALEGFAPANGSAAKLVSEVLRADASIGVHLVGHSYGAKIMALSAAIASNQVAEAEAKAEAESEAYDGRDIDSLILINPAFHPDELSRFEAHDESPFNFRDREIDVERAFRRIGRKAVVYSNFDQANGWIFSASQILWNNTIAQDYGYVTTPRDTRKSSLLERYLLHPIVDIPLAAVSTIVAGTNVALSGLDSVFGSVAKPFRDVPHHVVRNDTFDWAGPARYPLNFFHYFVPLDLPRSGGRPHDQLGILRPAKPALGRAGLDATVRGRRENFGLVSFVDPDGATARPPEDFVRMGIHPLIARSAELPDFDRPDRIYSFDASPIFNGKTPFIGAHGDLRKDDVIAQVSLCPGHVHQVRNVEFTMNFIFNFTQ